MIIENNILAISDVIFRNRDNWKYVTNEQKETFFFIFNRYLSKRYPSISMILNNKNIDKVMGMDLIYQFFENKPYPKWFWSKTQESKKNKTEDIINWGDLKDFEVKLIKHFYEEDVKEETDYLNKLKKQK